MPKDRLTAFSDGVIAIIITIMVLELQVPHNPYWSELLALWPTLSSYALSFLYVAIYWNNHHHMLHTVRHVSSGVLWANMHWLFWLSLIPFTTGWMGENHFAPVPVGAYGVTLLMTAIAYFILQWSIIWSQGDDSPLRRAVGKDHKGVASILFYCVGIATSFADRWISAGMFVMVALMWLIPDRRIEKVLHEMGLGDSVIDR